jgi:hypothetical protein
MAEAMQVEQDEEKYWELGSAFTQVLVAEINDALKAGGVEDAEQRQKICSYLAFGLGNFLDQQGIEVGGQKVYPLLCFSQKFLNIDVAPHDVEPLQLPAKGFEFHAAAGDVAHEFFSQGEQMGGVRVVDVGEE